MGTRIEDHTVNDRDNRFSRLKKLDVPIFVDVGSNSTVEYHEHMPNRHGFLYKVLRHNRELQNPTERMKEIDGNWDYHNGRVRTLIELGKRLQYVFDL